MLFALLLTSLCLGAWCATASASAPTFSFAFGTSGSGNGQFQYPGGATVDASGNVWVADTYNGRVQKFNSKGEYLTQFSTGTYLKDVAVDSEGNFWVSDLSYERVEKFNSEGESLVQFSGSGENLVGPPAGIAVDSEDNLWVVEEEYARVAKLNSEGELLTQFETNGGVPLGIAVDSSDNVFVTQFLNGRVEKFDSNGGYLGEFGSEGSGNGQLKYPIGISADAQGNVWVADYGNNRIEGFNSAGAYLAQFGTAGSGAGQFASPEGIASDSEGNLWVADTYNNRIQKWSKGSAESVWHIGGKTLADLKISNETVAMSGSFKMEIPNLGITYNCSESSSGNKITAPSSVEAHLTLSCKQAGIEKCTISPINIDLSGTGEALHPTQSTITVVRKGECGNFSAESVYSLPTTFTAAYGSEAANLSVTTAATGQFGGNPKVGCSHVVP